MFFVFRAILGIQITILVERLFPDIQAVPYISLGRGVSPVTLL